MAEHEFDLLKARDNLVKEIEGSINRSNALWEGLIRLMITLSSSFLLLTIAVVEKLFPNTAVEGDLSLLLVIAWICFFGSILCGVVQIICETIFHGNNTVDLGAVLAEYSKKIGRGEVLGKGKIKNNTLQQGEYSWGVLSINFFLFAIIFLCTAFLEKFITNLQSITILVISTGLLVILNIHLLSKKKNIGGK